MDGATIDAATQEPPTIINPVDFLERLEEVKVSLVDEFEAAVEAIIATEDLDTKRKHLAEYEAARAAFVKKISHVKKTFELEPISKEALTGHQKTQLARIGNLQNLFTMQAMALLQPMERILEAKQNGGAGTAKRIFSQENGEMEGYIGGRVRKEDDGKMVNPRNAENSWKLYQHVVELIDAEVAPQFREKMEAIYSPPVLAAE